MRCAVVAGILVLCVSVAGSETPPKPDFDRVDHAKPKKALAICPQFGSASEIKEIAKGLKQDDPVATIRAIDEWVRANFAYNAQHFDRWRSFKQMRKDGTYGGCADHAILFGHLTRAAGIPTVFVKSMDCFWIRAYAAGVRLPGWSGHCFLEVHVDGEWALLDASMMKLYRDYDPRIRILPGCRYAYDKGLDPYKLVKSVRWELWKRQTEAYFKDFDVTQLPVGEGEVLATQRASVAADGPYYKWLRKRCEALGLGSPGGFNSDFYNRLRRASGRLLIVTCVGDRLVFPDHIVKGYLPMTMEEIQAALEKEHFGSARGRAWDGTTVVLLYARDQASMRKAVDAFKFP